MRKSLIIQLVVLGVIIGALSTLVAIFILTFFNDQIESLVATVGNQLLGLTDETDINGLRSAVFSIAFIAIVFASYAGTTLEFVGKPARGFQGFLFSLLIGALNGYLIAGTLWYYQHKYDYPIKEIVAFDTTLTTRATAMVARLPQNLFENPVYWIVPVAVLLILRVRR